MLATHTLRARLGDLSRALTGGPVRPGEAPLVRAPLPFLGHALAVGRDLRALLRDCQRAHGDVFTLLVAGQRMTFVLDPFSYPHVLKAQGDLSFHELGEQFGQRAFGYLPFERSGVDGHAIEGFFTEHLKGAGLAPLTARAGERLRVALAREASGAWRETDLHALVARCVFIAGIEALFGDGAADEQLVADFMRFDRWFPLLVAGTPISVLPGARAAFARLIAVSDVTRPDISLFMRAREALLSRSTTRDDKNRLQAGLIWAAAANTIPAAFWSLAYLVRDAAARAEVLAELAAHGTDDLKRLPKLQSAVNEALRLSSSSLTIRAVRRDCDLTLESGRTITLFAGDRVALTPVVTHYDPDIFADPEAYRFDRFLADGGPRQFFKHGKRVPIPLMPYGGGVSMCPGRFLANNEVMQFVALALTELDLELLGPALPPFDNARAGLGVLPPKGDVRCRLRRRG
jgi:cytochrome P450